MLDLVGRELDISFVLYRGCEPMVDQKTVFDDREAGYPCAAVRDLALSYLADRPGMWVLPAALWAGLPAVLSDGRKAESSVEAGLKLMTNGLEETVRAIDPARHPILLLGQFPQVLGVNPLCAQRTLSTLLMRSCHTEMAINAVAERAYLKPTDDALKMIAERNQSRRYQSNGSAMHARYVSDRYKRRVLISRRQSHPP